MKLRAVLTICLCLPILASLSLADLQENTEKVAEVIQGEGWVQKNGRKQELHEGDIVYAEEVIVTQKKSVKIRLWQKLTTLEIKRDSELKIVSKSVFKVLRGDVKSKIYAGEPLMFETPLVRFGAYGTEFLVRVKPDTTYVGLSEGEIKVRALDSESGQMTTLSPNLMLRATPDEPLKIAPLPKKSSTPKLVLLGVSAVLGIGGYLIHHYAGNCDPVPSTIGNLQEAINAAEYVRCHLDSTANILNPLRSDTVIDKAYQHVYAGSTKVVQIRDGGENIRGSMQTAKYVIAAVAAAGIAYSISPLFRDRDVYREIEDPKWWVSLKPDLLGENPSMKLALNVRF